MKKEEDSLVKAPEPITRKILMPTNSSLTDNTVVSDLSHDTEYDQFWDINDEDFELKMNHVADHSS